MILATSGLIIIVVAGLGVLNFLDIAKVYDETTTNTQARIRAQVEAVGEAMVETVAASSRTYFEQSNDLDMRAYIGRLASQNDEISFIYIVDDERGLVAHSDPGKNPTQGHPPVAEPSWPVLASHWERAPDQLIVGIEQERVALFGLPVAPHGYVVIGYSLRGLDEAVAELRREKLVTVRTTLLKTALVGLIFVLLGTVLAIAQAVRMAKPIKELAARAQQIASGDLRTRAEVHAADEIGLLADNFNHMADQIAVLLEMTFKRAALDRELDLARAIQMRLVPERDALSSGPVELAAYFEPADKCGGDWWTVCPLGDGRLLLIIADVTGHGIAAAMIATAAKAACDAVRRMSSRLAFSDLMRSMNEAVYDAAAGEFIMTAFAAIIDPESRRIDWINAGHNFPYLLRNHGSARRVSCLLPGGFPLGAKRNATFEVQTASLEHGDRIVFFTDGLIECENGFGEMYGERRLRRMLSQIAELSPTQARDALIGDALEFFGENPRKDDITLIVARVQ